jgi:hypothetical protein
MRPSRRQWHRETPYERLLLREALYSQLLTTPVQKEDA